MSLDKTDFGEFDIATIILNPLAMNILSKLKRVRFRSLARSGLLAKGN